MFASISKLILVDFLIPIWASYFATFLCDIIYKLVLQLVVERNIWPKSTDLVDAEHILRFYVANFFRNIQTLSPLKNELAVFCYSKVNFFLLLRLSCEYLKICSSQSCLSDVFNSTFFVAPQPVLLTLLHPQTGTGFFMPVIKTNSQRRTIFF